MRRALWLVLLFGCDDAATTTPDAGPQPIEIIVDSLGVAHVYAANDEDLFFGYGYQIASDRMYQLEMFRRRAHGRLSEVLGELTAIEDNQARIFNWKHWGALDAAKMRAELPARWALIRAWVEGINRRVAEIRSGEVPRPFGFRAEDHDFLPEAWQPEDVLIVQKMAGFGLDETIEFEIFVTFAYRLFARVMDNVTLFLPARDTYIQPNVGGRSTMRLPRPGLSLPGELPRGALAGLKALARMKGQGSNSWAVGPEHTADGRSMLAGDPHIGCDFSGLMYPIHLSSAHAAGSFDAIGYAFVAAPGIAAGHNRRLAWTPTSSFADVMDMWDVLIDADGAHLGDRVVPVAIREETIRVRADGDPVGEGAERTLSVTDVPGLGVVVPGAALGSPIPIATTGRQAVVGWRGFDARTANYFLELNRAETLDDFDAAVLRMPEMSYNFVAATAEGITYRVGVEVPERSPVAPGREPWQLMDGDDPAAFWGPGALGPETLPHTRAEARGWIATANNDPFGHTADGVVEGEAFYYGAFYPPGWRAGRIEAELTRLAARGGITREDMQALQTDTHSNLADDLLPLLARAFGNSVEDPELGALVAEPRIGPVVTLLLEQWDRQMERDSAGALAFHAFAHLVAGRVMRDDISLLYDIVMEVQPVYLLKLAVLALNERFPDAGLLQEGRDAIILQALADTAALLEDRFGSTDPNSYRLADLRKTVFDGGFGLGMPLVTAATDGGESTVNVAATVFLVDGAPAPEWLGTWIPIERTVTTFAEDGTPQAWSAMPQGNVADPDGGHFDDRMQGWLDGGYQRLPFTRAEVEAAEAARTYLRR